MAKGMQLPISANNTYLFAEMQDVIVKNICVSLTTGRQKVLQAPLTFYPSHQRLPG